MKITHEVKRKIIQIAAFGYSNPYLSNFAGGRLYQGKWKQFCNPGMNCYSCPAAGLACPIGAMQAVGGSRGFSVSFYVLGMVLALGLVLGRAVCGFLCPFGFMQELIHKLLSPKLHLPRPVTYLKYVLLAVFVLGMPAVMNNSFGTASPAFCEYICPVGTLEAGIPMLATHPELRKIIGGLFSLKVIILILTLTGCVLVSRFFCKAMCPLGAIYGLLNKISLYRMEVDHASCINCGSCGSLCPMDVDPVKDPNSAECIRCGRCVHACPASALKLGFRMKETEKKIITNSN